MEATSGVLEDVRAEREAQDRKWGPPRLDLPDGTGSDDHLFLIDLVRLGGEPTTFAEILEEEVAEALVETDPSKLRAELVQVAAVAVKWIEVLDARAALEAARG